MPRASLCNIDHSFLPPPARLERRNECYARISSGTISPALTQRTGLCGESVEKRFLFAAERALPFAGRLFSFSFGFELGIARHIAARFFRGAFNPFGLNSNLIHPLPFQRLKPNQSGQTLPASHQRADQNIIQRTAVCSELLTSWNYSASIASSLVLIWGVSCKTTFNKEL
jgi:hypothetical protein